MPRTATHETSVAGLGTLLNNAVGLTTNAKVKNDPPRKVAVATGSDGQQCVFSLAELHRAFGHPPVLIGVMASGAPLGANGMAELVVPSDGKPGRWVTNPVSLEVPGGGSAPEPASRSAVGRGCSPRGPCGRSRCEGGRLTTLDLLLTSPPAETRLPRSPP